MVKNSKKQPESSETADLSEKTDTPIQTDKETGLKKVEKTQTIKEANFEKELKKDEIVREKPPKKAGRPKKEVVRNEKGERLTKKGTVDKRAEQGLVNLQKSKVYQKILENKKLKEETKGKVAILSPIVDDDTSDDDIEFVIEEDQDMKQERTQTKLYLEKQEQIRQQELKDQLNKFEEENKKLKESFNYNSHLNRISNMATSVKLKF